MSMTDTPFDAKRARQKAAMPLWADALLRDTMALQADEFGAYMRILLALWSTPDLCLPDDDRRLAVIGRVDVRSWKSRIGPVLRPLLQAQDGVIWSRKMREVARETEVYLATKSRASRVRGKNVTDFVSHTPVEIREVYRTDESADLFSNPLETNKPGLSHDTSFETSPERARDTSPDLPSKDPSKKKEEEGVRASARVEISSSKDPLLERVIEAVGLTPEVAPRYWTGEAAALHVRGWLASFGLSEADVVAEARHSRGRNPEPPDGPKALDRWMEQAGIAKRAVASNASQPKPDAAPAKPSTSPEERLRYYAGWVKDLTKPMAGSVITNTLRDSLLQAGLVTKADLRKRGILL